MTPESFLEPELCLEGETLTLSGIVTYRTVEKVWLAGLSNIKEALTADLLVDLSKLTQCDSSGLALCTAWSRAASLQQKRIEFIHVPAFMKDLIRVYGLDTVLNIQKDTQPEST